MSELRRSGLQAYVSIVVPLFNEEENVVLLAESIQSKVKALLVLKF